MTNPFFSFKLSEIIKASMYTASPIIRLLGFPITFTPNLTFFPLVLLKNMSCNRSIVNLSISLTVCIVFFHSFIKTPASFFYILLTYLFNTFNNIFILHMFSYYQHPYKGLLKIYIPDWITCHSFYLSRQSFVRYLKYFSLTLSIIQIPTLSFIHLLPYFVPLKSK